MVITEKVQRPLVILLLETRRIVHPALRAYIPLDQLNVTTHTSDELRPVQTARLDWGLWGHVCS